MQKPNLAKMTLREKIGQLALLDQRTAMSYWENIEDKAAFFKEHPIGGLWVQAASNVGDMNTANGIREGFNEKDYALVYSNWIDNINQNEFSLKNIKITPNSDYLQITGVLKNNTNTEKTFTINSSIYNEQKKQLDTKDITLDTKIQPKDEIPIFINHYYDEFELEYNNIDYYKINITK